MIKPRPINYIRLLYRFLLVGLSVLVAIFFIRKNNGTIVAHKWAKWLTKRLNVHITVRGNIPNNNTRLYVSNHKSYIEGIAILAQTPLTFLGKEEVRYWPIIGLGAAYIGTVFVKRENKESRKIAAQNIKERLLEGKSLLVFPEGTTQDGHVVNKFFPGSFFVVVDIDIPVVPIAVRYVDDTDSFKDELFLTNFSRVFSKKKIEIILTFGEELTHPDPIVLCDMSRNSIQNMLDNP